MAMRNGEVYFLDTNILLIATDQSRKHHQAGKRIFSAARQAGAELAISGQVLREYLVVATRPLERNGLGMKGEDALENVRAFRERTVFYEETEAVSNRLTKLVSESDVRGTRIHDANVAATMLAHGICNIFTENTSDFKGFQGISIHSVRTPSQPE